MFNAVDMIFQFLMFFMLIAIIFTFIYIYKSVLKKNSHQHSNSVEKKLDRIIELLEKDKHL